MRPKINIITLAVTDLEASITFYKNGLGFPTKGLPEGENHILFELQDNFSFVLFPRKELSELTSTNSQIRTSEFILSYIADSKEEVDTVLQRAEKFGGTILPNQPKEFEWGYSGHFQDLDGHTWEIVSFLSE